jgi:hypothetical protein
MYWARNHPDPEPQLDISMWGVLMSRLPAASACFRASTRFLRDFGPASPASLGPFRWASMPSGVIATARPGKDARPHGPTDVERSETQKNYETAAYPSATLAQLTTFHHASR